MTDFRDFEKEMCDWGDETFPNGTPETIIAHLKRELIELEQAVDSNGQAEEVADCFMMLLHLARKTNRDILAEAQRKFEIVKLREWAPPDDQGVVEHIRDKE